jgi:hypothetical protein
MKNSKALKVILFVSGLIAISIGGMVLVQPAAFYATNGIDLAGNVSLLNEIRASGGALLAAGILILSGAFVASLTFTAVVVASLLYLSYGLSRILSFTIDGMPLESLVQAAALEVVIGVLCVYFFVRYRE